MKGPQSASLKRFNTFMGFLHLVQGLGMLYLALSVDKFAAFKLPVLTNFLKFDATQMRLVSVPGKIADVPFAVLVSCFLSFPRWHTSSSPQSATRHMTAIWRRALTASDGMNTP